VALNWKSVTAEHVRAALKQMAASKSTDRASGLIIVDGDRKLSAKEVLRVAYRLANKLPNDATVGRRQLLLPLTTIILAGLRPSSLVHHHAV